ncbi:hypothetical protein J6590_092344 [Homalodisca vitripennis]|nr:hypothetical protein J6590_092344 [Homalodisca vitripennis]
MFSALDERKYEDDIERLLISSYYLKGFCPLFPRQTKLVPPMSSALMGSGNIRSHDLARDLRPGKYRSEIPLALAFTPSSSKE